MSNNYYEKVFTSGFAHRLEQEEHWNLKQKVMQGDTWVISEQCWDSLAANSGNGHAMPEDC